MAAETTTTVTTFSQLLATFRKEVSNLVAHAVTLGGTYALLAHSDLTRIESAASGAIAVAIGALVNKLRTEIKL